MPEATRRVIEENSQAAHTKHGIDANLPHLSQLQGSQLIHRQYHNHNVLQYIHSRIRPCSSVVIHTYAFSKGALVPSERNRLALENRHQDESQHTRRTEGNHQPAKKPERFLRENAEVEKDY